MKIAYKNKIFYVTCDFQESSILRRCGFNWHKTYKCWYTPFALNVKKLKKLSCPDTIALVDRVLAQDAKEIASTMCVSENSTTLDIPAPPGLSYMPFQKIGISILYSRPQSLLADEMGLGKTIQAIGLCNYVKDIDNVLIICPASLQLNWVREWEKWTTLRLNITQEIGPCLKNGVTVVSYNKVQNNFEKLTANDYSVLIMDESHYLKNQKANRTKVILGRDKGRKFFNAKRTIAITGTPILNRPIEIFSIAQYLYPQGFPYKTKFAKRYCGLGKNYMGRWDYNGASNLEELNDVLRKSIMIRRFKADVLKELPPKTRQIIEFDVEAKSFIDKDKIFKKLIEGKDFDSMISELSLFRKRNFEIIAQLRKETGMSKLKHCISHIKLTLESTDKLVIFAHHRDMVYHLEKEFKSICSVVHGGTTMKARDKAVNDFQTSKKCKLFIGNIQAAGVGLTLTAANHCIFTELDWVPANMLQAEDRIHRIGSEIHSNVLIQYLVAANSLDSYIANEMVRKLDIIDRSVNMSQKLQEFFS